MLPAEPPPSEGTPTDLAVPATPPADDASEDEADPGDAAMSVNKRGSADGSSREASAEGREHRKRTPPPARRRTDADRGTSR